MVRAKGVEPSLPKEPEPKSGASTNSATRARYYRYFLATGGFILLLLNLLVNAEPCLLKGFDYNHSSRPTDSAIGPSSFIKSAKPSRSIC